MVIGTVHSKSVGKTTLAVHMAGWLHLYDYDVVLVDADWQQQSSSWLAGAAPEIETRVIREPDKIAEEVPKLCQHFQVVIVDGPAGLASTAGAVLSVSDAVIIPCGPGAPEILALQKVAKTIRQAQEHRKATEGKLKPGGVIVPVRTNPRRLTTKALLSEASKLGLAVTKRHVPARETYARLAGLPGERPRLLWQLGRSKDVKHAVLEMDALFREIFPEACEHDPDVFKRMMSKPIRNQLTTIAETYEEHEQRKTVNA